MGTARRRDAIYLLGLLAIGIAGFWPNLVPAQRTDPIHTTASISTVASTVLPLNTKRNFLLIQNNSDTAIYCKFDAVAVANQGIGIPPNLGALTLDVKFSSGPLSCITASGSGKVLMVTEGQQ